MSMRLHLNKYIQEKPLEVKIKYLRKAWIAKVIPPQVILDSFIYFMKKENFHYVDEIETKQFKKFFDLKYPNNVISIEKKAALVDVFTTKLELAVQEADYVVKICTQLLEADYLRELFQQRPKVLIDFVIEMLKQFQFSFKFSTNLKYPVTLNAIFRVLMFFCKSKEFKQYAQGSNAQLFIKLFEVVNYIKENYDNPIYFDKLIELLDNTYFSQVGLEDNKAEDVIQDALDVEMYDGVLYSLLEIVIKKKRSKIGEINHFLNFFIEYISCNLSGFYTLKHLRELYRLLNKYEIDLSGLKRTNAETFNLLEEGFRDVIDIDSFYDPDLNSYLQCITSLLEFDPFLFKNIYCEVLVGFLFTDKELLDIEVYQKHFSSTFKIFGKDIIHFISNLVTSIEEKLEGSHQTKTGKRKLSDGIESKRKRIHTENGHEEISFSEDMWSIKIWSDQFTTQFADAVTTLNVKQSLKLWDTLNIFLQQYLIELKESDTPNENLLFKLDLITNFTSHFLQSSRLHEHLCYKSEMILEIIEKFNKIQDCFHSLILNIEYNDRLMNAFLNLSYNYEDFLLIYFYNYNPDMKSQLSPMFINSKFGKSNEWIVIKQRIKNFGKTREKNFVNMLDLQHYLKSILFDRNEKLKVEDVEKILADASQTEFILRKNDLRSMFLQNLKPDELATLCQFLLELNDMNIIKAIANHPQQLEILIEKFLGLLLNVKDNGKTDLKIEDVEQVKKIFNYFDALPLNFLKIETKKMIVCAILEVHEKFSDSEIKFTPILADLFANDGYKNFFKDFKLKKLLKTFKDVEKHLSIFQIIFQSTIKRINQETLENLKYLLQYSEKNENNAVILFEVIMKIFIDSNVTGAGVSAAEIKNFKTEAVNLLFKHYCKKDKSKKKVENFVKFNFLLKVASPVYSELKQELRKDFQENLEKLIRFAIKSGSSDALELLMTALKTSDKFNLTEKDTIIEHLLKCLKNETKMSLTIEKTDVEIEISLLDSLKNFKPELWLTLLQHIEECMRETSRIREDLLKYVITLLNAFFKIYLEAMAANPVLKQKNNQIVITFSRISSLVMVNFIRNDIKRSAEAISQYLELYLTILKNPHASMEDSVIDYLITVMMDIQYDLFDNIPDIEDLSKVLTLYGDILYIISNYKKQYFVSRIPQFKIVYFVFVNSIYRFKNNSNDVFSQMEIDLLQKLTLQMENIMRNVINIHLNAFRTVLPFFTARLIDIVVRNPKTLSSQDKLKINLNNVCKLLIFHMDDRVRNHILVNCEEAAREVFQGFMKEIRRK